MRSFGIVGSNFGLRRTRLLLQDGDSRIELGREKVLPLNPLETLVLRDDGDLNRASDRLWTRYGKPDESDRRFH